VQQRSSLPPLFTNYRRRKTMQTDPVVTITITLSDAQAEAFAQFLKRVGLSDFAALTVDQEEAYRMLSAGEVIRQELAHAGYAPR
jgi:hypothetical protein